MTTTCQARCQSDGTFRCIRCKLAWDVGDAPPCPIESPSIVPALPEREPFVSGLPTIMRGEIWTRTR